jgi:N-acetylneuraminate synthase
MRSLTVGKATIGGGAPCFIIAEAGSNHDGRLEQAKRLIDVAVRAGADAVKFQTFRAERMYTRRAGRSDYLKVAKSIFDIIKDMEMPFEWIPQLAAYCRRSRILFISTPFDEDAADRLAPHVDVFKIASYELTHSPLLRHVAAKGKPMLLSTGAATIDEVAAAVDVLRRSKARGFALMQCTAAYPAPPEALNVAALVGFRKRFGCPAGLSDHSRDPLTGPMTAAALGADLLEKHFTLSNELPGPDHRFAVTPDELCELVRRVRDVETVRGNGLKRVEPAEAELRAFARRSLFATRAIPRGERFTRDCVAALRNGKAPAGLPPDRLEAILGRTARRTVRAWDPIRSGDVG